MITKTCTSCGEEKSLSEFYKATRMKDGHQSRCKICMRESYNESRAKKKDHYNRVRRDRMSNKTAKWRKWKEERGCSFCDEAFGPCLQLHHLDPSEKESAISDMIAQDASWAAIMEEAAKGIIVCGNCHTKIHYDIIQID